MHILLTDHLVCPRCGPGHGLIALADAIADRHVLEGRLGCPNCREEYPIRRGVADLRISPGPPLPAGAAGGDGAYRLAALLGVGSAPGTVLVHGADPALVAEVAELLPNAQVVGATRGLPSGGAPPELSWVLHSGAFPFRDGALRGVALTGPEALATAGDAARILMQGAQLLLDPAPAGSAAALRELGLEILLDQGGVVVAFRPRAG